MRHACLLCFFTCVLFLLVVVCGSPCATMQGAMRKAAKVSGFNRRVGEAQSKPKLQQLVARLKKTQQEEVEVWEKAEAADWEAEVAQAKKWVQEARRALQEFAWNNLPKTGGRA